MSRSLIAGCEQEIASFNPVPSDERAFDIHVGDDLLAANRDTDTCIRGAIDVLGARPDVTLVPVYAAKGCSAGLLARSAFKRITGDLLELLRRHAEGFDPRDLAAAGVSAVATAADLDAARHVVRGVQVADVVLGYMVDLCRATRAAPSVEIGASPRGRRLTLLAICSAVSSFSSMVSSRSGEF